MTVSTSALAFVPSGHRGEFAAGTTVLDAARSLGVDLDSVCGGRAICGRCTIVPDRDVPISAAEAALRTRRTIEPQRRLACCVDVAAVGRVTVPTDSQIHRPVVRKDLADASATRPLDLDPVVTLHYIEFDEAAASTLSADVPTDSERLVAALADQWQIFDVAIARPVLGAWRARRGASAITAAVRDRVVVAVWPGFVDRALGIAVDIGSTTIAAHLADVTTGDILASAGVMNPQIRFGDDVMSRVSYVMLDNAPPTRARELTASVRSALDALIGDLVAEVGAGRDDVVDVTVVANPIMHHLFLDLDAIALGVAPFALATADPLDIAATDIDLDLPFASVHVLPCIAGHVGADAAAVVLADRPDARDDISLVIDVGTNAELVLARGGLLWAASSPTGPAFEGAQISCGQRAAVGAIERVRIDPETHVVRVKVIGCDAWSDAPDFAAPSITGVCGSGIVEALGELVRAGVIDADGVINSAGLPRSERVIAHDRTWSFVLWDSPRLLITQADVRAIQLAKAALVAGGRLLMAQAGVDRLDRVALAGAFGSHLDPDYARAIALVPLDGDPHVESIGNAAGDGALRALLSRAERQTVATLARDIVKIETATEPGFQPLFVAGLAFPGVSTNDGVRRRGGRRGRVGAQSSEDA